MTASDKLAEIERICDAAVSRIPTLDPGVPWDALADIHKVLRS